MTALVAEHKLAKQVQVVEGGDNRQQSVGNALKSIPAADEDIILVHDAVRPFVTREIIREVIAAAQKYGAAIAGVPAVDTVKQVERTAEGALITATLPRERVVLAQTPQGFRYGLLKKVFDEAAADGATLLFTGEPGIGKTALLDAAAEAAQAPASTRLLTKPFSRNTVLRAVREVLGHARGH